ncbi:MAG: hypothetical protein IT381_13855 [Deltaproteobacteria bacterium]|nr:hypothetical protein [Deltaproteobacteria bacterium]
MRQHIRSKKLGDLFPFGQALSNVLFRLTIVREDLLLELAGASNAKFKKLDRSEPLARKIYFIRRSCMSLHIALDILNEKSVKKYVERNDNALSKKMVKLRDRLRTAEKELEFLRNKAVAHLDAGNFNRVLQKAGSLEWFVQLSSHRVVDIQWRVASVGAMFALSKQLDTEEDFNKDSHRLLTEISQFTASTIQAIDGILFEHLRMRGYWDRRR